MSASSSNGSEPPAKRSREIAANDDMPMDTNCTTKLDALNIDVLNTILDYLSIDDIIGSITVSRQWQAKILDYLRSSRFCFEHYTLPRMHFVPRLLGLINEVRDRRVLPFDMTHGDLQRFQRKVELLGPAIVSIILDFFDETTLKCITPQTCPNVQNLILVGLNASRPHEPNFPLHHAANEQREPHSEERRQCLQQLELKRVSFVHSPYVTEDYISEFLHSESIEELVICRNRAVEGRFLTHLKSDLKCLRLVACSLKFIHLNNVSDRLTSLTMLDLSNNPSEILQNVHHLLDKTSNLQHLFLNSYEKMNVGSEFVGSLRRLGQLKHLSLCWNDNVCDEWLEAVTHGSRILETVDIEIKNARTRQAVTVRGVTGLCRGAPCLKHLGLAGHAADDQLLEACITACPMLESVDLRGCKGVSGTLPALLAAARALAAAPARTRQPCSVRLRLARTGVNKYQNGEPPEGLTYDFVDAPRIFRLV